MKEDKSTKVIENTNTENKENKTRRNSSGNEVDEFVQNGMRALTDEQLDKAIGGIE